MLQDVRYALRQFGRRPALTTLAVLSFAIGIGANTLVYTWARSLLFDPFPGVAGAGSLVVANVTDRDQGYISFSYPVYRDYRDRTRTLSGLVAMRATVLGIGVAGGTTRAYAQIVTGNVFDVLGVRMAHGRGFLPEEDTVALRDAVIVLGHGLWQRQFGSDPGVVGRTLRVNGHPFTVIGVAPAGFTGTQAGLTYEAWVPMMMQEWVEPGGAGRLDQRGNGWLSTIGRLAPGRTLAEAQAEFTTIAAALAAEYPDNARAGAGIDVAPLWRAPRTAAEILGPVLLVLGVVVALVLVIAASNVAHLLLARAMGRRREMAVRTAVGASRGRLIRQLVIESLLLSLAGGAAGVALAQLGTRAIQGILPQTDAPIVLAGRIDATVLMVTLAISAVTGLVFGLAPAWQSSRADVSGVLREESASAGSPLRRRRWFGGLVVVQVTLSVVLLIGAALFVRSLDRARTYDVGFEARGVALVSTELFSSGYDRARGQAFFTRLLDEAAALPGVERVALARRVPLGFGGSSSTTFVVDGDERPSRDPAFGYLNVVSGGYFALMKIPLLEGRDFAPTDVTGAPFVAIVNQTMANRYWQGRPALGGRFRIGPDWVTVVGIARDSTYRELQERPAPFFYVPVTQWHRTDMSLLGRTSGDAASVASALRDHVRRLDPTINVFEPRTLEGHIEAARFRQKLAGQLLAALGVIGLVLAVVGLYGTLTFGVAQRRHEIGVRLAIGGDRGAIVWMIARDGLVLVGIGTALGVVLALALVQPLSQLLLGVKPWDPRALAGVLALLTLSTGLACAVPAWRAASTDPLRALRGE